MCVIFACPHDGKLPLMEELEGGASANDDGAGVGWSDGTTVFWKKGLKHADVEKMIEEGVLKPPCIIHYRIASVGEALPELTHPFPCSTGTNLDLAGQSPTNPILFHNGTVSHWREEMKLAITSGKGTIKVPAGEWSDSRVLAFLVGTYGFRYLDFIEGLVGDKVALLQPNGSIFYFGDWQWKDGFYASNTSYLFGRKGKGGVGNFPSAGASHLLTPASATTVTEATVTQETEPEETEDVAGAWSRAEMQSMVKELKGKSLILGIEVRV